MARSATLHEIETQRTKRYPVRFAINIYDMVPLILSRY